MSCGAEVILVPEIEMDFDRHVIRRLLECRNQDKHHYIVVVAEGVGDTLDISKRIESTTGIESRVTILGHLQRGGSPTIRDRMMASYMGAEAVKCIAKGEFGRVIALQNGSIVDVDIVKALGMKDHIEDQIMTAYDIAL